MNDEYIEHVVLAIKQVVATSSHKEISELVIEEENNIKKLLLAVAHDLIVLLVMDVNCDQFDTVVKAKLNATKLV